MLLYQKIRKASSLGDDRSVRLNTFALSDVISPKQPCTPKRRLFSGMWIDEMAAEIRLMSYGITYELTQENDLRRNGGRILPLEQPRILVSYRTRSRFSPHMIFSLWFEAWRNWRTGRQGDTLFNNLEMPRTSSTRLMILAPDPRIWRWWDHWTVMQSERFKKLIRTGVGGKSWHHLRGACDGRLFPSAAGGYEGPGIFRTVMDAWYYRRSQEFAESEMQFIK
jgi:hypothetical protein